MERKGYGAVLANKGTQAEADKSRATSIVQGGHLWQHEGLRLCRSCVCTLQCLLSPLPSSRALKFTSLMNCVVVSVLLLHWQAIHG
eukprot:373626-Pelagomonas_calceolata.AAC.2